MSSELRIASGSGVVIYAHLINSAGQIWNGTAFEAYSSANWTAYGVTLTEQGASGVYIGSFPTTVASSDTYDVFYYLRNGGTQAETDVIVGTGQVVWNGTNVSSSVSPTLVSIVAEGLAKAGYSNPSSTLTARAQTKWMAEIKSDIWSRAKRAKFLQTRTVQSLTKGLGRYSNPADYASDMSMVFATGKRYGALQAGSASSLTLIAAETATLTELIGREVAIISGLGSGGISYITAYNPTTKVASISPSLDTAPTVGDNYVILDQYQDVREEAIYNLRSLRDPSQQGYPVHYYPEGDSTNGKFLLHPIPYREDAQPMVLIQRYYVDITELDLSSTLMATLYQKWLNLWTYGIKWKAFEDADDDRAITARQEYANEVQKIIRALYGNELIDVQARVGDYS